MWSKLLQIIWMRINANWIAKDKSKSTIYALRIENSYI
jgi:hypothetical protein